MSLLLLYSQPGLTYRALVLSNGAIREILSAELGTGLKPIVMMSDGQMKQRLSTEGVAIVSILGVLNQLPTTATLLI